MTLQLDLFGEVQATERKRLHDTLTCLRHAIPDALTVVAELRNWNPSDSRSPRKTGPWAYCISDAGLRVEHEDTWGISAYHRGEPWGWHRTPAHLTTWDELTDLIGHDPRRAEIVAWVKSLHNPSWWVLSCPNEMSTDYTDGRISQQRSMCTDHINEHWPARRHAWQLVHDLLDDAINNLEAS